MAWIRLHTRIVIIRYWKKPAHAVAQNKIACPYIVCCICLYRPIKSANAPVMQVPAESSRLGIFKRPAYAMVSTIQIRNEVGFSPSHAILLHPWRAYSVPVRKWIVLIFILLCFSFLLIAVIILPTSAIRGWHDNEVWLRLLSSGTRFVDAQACHSCMSLL